MADESLQLRSNELSRRWGVLPVALPAAVPTAEKERRPNGVGYDDSNNDKSREGEFWTRIGDFGGDRGCSNMVEIGDSATKVCTTYGG